MTSPPMDFNFNKKGAKYAFLAVGQSRHDFGALSDNAAEYLNKLYQIVAEKYKRARSDADRKLIISATGCIERLTAFLLQMRRIALHAEKIYRQGNEQEAGKGGAMVILNPNEVLFDFESLLFQGRASLDRLALFLSNQIYRQDCDRFNKLVNVLEDFRQKDPRIVCALKIIEECLPTFHGLLLDSKDGEKSLRSDLIHKSTAGERTSCAFVLYLLPTKQVIRFDYEMRGYPLLGSAWVLSKHVPYLVLNILGTYLGHSDSLAITKCEPIWKNRFVHFSKFIDPTSNGPEFSAAKMNPSGVEIMTMKLKSSVLELAEDIPAIDTDSNPSAVPRPDTWTQV